jgi:hypothetical protein
MHSYTLFQKWRNSRLCLYDKIWYLFTAIGFPPGRYVKVKCTLVQALRLCIGRTAHRGRKGILVALLFHDHGTRRVWGFSVTPRPLFTPKKDLEPIVQEAGWAPTPVWTGAENLAPTGIQSPDRPARSQSLYRLRYPVAVLLFCKSYNIWRLKSRWSADWHEDGTTVPLTVVTIYPSTWYN